MRANGLGDAIRLFGVVPFAELPRALRMLGLELRSESSGPLPADIVIPPLRIEPRETDEPVELPPPAVPDSPNDALVERSSTAASYPKWYDDARELPSVPDGDDTPPPVESLLTPGWERSVLTAALAGVVWSSELDVEAIVERTARLVALEPLPRLRRRSLRAGAHLIIDLGDSMQPFFQDAQRLARAAALLLARERLHLVAVRTAPSVTTISLQPVGVPVVIVSNFGIISRRTAALVPTVGKWTELATELRRRGRHAIALSPLDPAIVPASLRRVLPVVAWDRITGAAQVTHARSAAAGGSRRA